MNQVFIDQGTLEWHELRRTKIGASVSSALLGKHPYLSERDVYEQMALGKVPFVNSAMKRGTHLEPIAREFFNGHYLTNFVPIVCVNDQFPSMMASLDGYEKQSNSILEIKAPGDKVFAQCMNDKIPIHWEYQIQHQLLVSQAELAKLFIWNDEEHYELKIYSRNEAIMSEIKEACERFYNENLLQFRIPIPKENDYPIDEDEELKDLVNRYILARDKKKEYESLEEILKEQIVEFCKGSSKRTANAVIEKYEVKGRIDYEMIDALKTIDIEHYRKPTTIRWKISEVDVK